MIRVGFATISSSCKFLTQSASTIAFRPPLYSIASVSIVPNRQSSFFKSGGADPLWKTMAGVSQQGKKRGRARNLMHKKDLNRGQMLGYGKAKIRWPVLTSKAVQIDPGTRTEKATTIEPMSDTIYDNYTRRLDEERKGLHRRGFSRSQHPLDRGWSGGKPLGKKFGPPQAINRDLAFDQFETILLEFKTVFKMTGNLGRVRRNSIVMVTGNGQGAVGYTVSAGKYGSNASALKKAVNKAGLRLIYVDRYEDRTVYHDFFTQYGQTRIYVQQMPPGHGIRAHRVIKAICDMCGIKDLYAKCEGSTNVQHVVKAFMLGLLRQRTHQVLADEKGLHLVEMRKENDYFPRVVASPSNGKVNPWSSTPQWGKHLRRGYVNRSKYEVAKRMRIEHGPQWGSVRSHLYDKYPECVERNWPLFTKLYRERKAGKEE